MGCPPPKVPFLSFFPRRKSHFKFIKSDSGEETGEGKKRAPVALNPFMSATDIWEKEAVGRSKGREGGCSSILEMKSEAGALGQSKEKTREFLLLLPQSQLSEPILFLANSFVLTRPLRSPEFVFLSPVFPSPFFLYPSQICQLALDGEELSSQSRWRSLDSKFPLHFGREGALKGFSLFPLRD